MPATMVMFFCFIGCTQGAEQTFQATTTFPLALAFTALYMVTYAALARRGAATALAGSLLVWLALESVLVAADVENLAVSMAAWALVFAGSYFLLVHGMKVTSQGRIAVAYRPAQVVDRGIFSGSIVAPTVVMSKIGGPIFGAVFSAFPALSMSTLTITSRSAGVEFARSMITPLLASSSITCIVFAAVVRFAVLEIGLLWATVLAYVATLGSAYVTYLFVKARLA